MALPLKIIETARALKMDPLDLATIISYETAGTFDPKKKGPTTQWGQHRGLIQFGEPQAKQYGVNWDDPMGSQLGADGAVAKYFLDNGWQPGMGMMDAYSIVNAGGPGRYNRSDANNGGAPGTVADKVNNQMAGHRRNAEKLLANVSLTSEPQQPSPHMGGATQTTAGPLHTGTKGYQPPPAIDTAAGPLHTGTPDIGGAMWGQPEKESIWDKLAGMSEDMGTMGQQGQGGVQHVQMAPRQAPDPAAFQRRDSGYADMMLSLLEKLQKG